MTNKNNGWGLTGRLIVKHFGNLGDTISEALASFDPETATQADRDQLQATLISTATKLAAARSSFQKEHDDVVKLQTLIESDLKIKDEVIKKLSEGAITEDAVNLFCDELEANQNRLPLEKQEEATAKEYLDELNEIVNQITKQLEEFDQKAKKALSALKLAQSQKDLAQLKIDNAAQIGVLKEMGGHSTALNALAKKAEKVTNEASGLNTVLEVTEKSGNQAATVEALRQTINAPQNESAAERLARMASKP